METQVTGQEIELIDKELKESELYDKKRKMDLEHKLVGRLTSLPQLLRYVGASVILTSAATFLMQQWGGMDHVLRYYSFLAFTLVLSGCGFLCGMSFREDKGARTFLAIAAAIVPVHFLQLGGLLFSRFGYTSSSIPSYFRWVAPDATTALVTSGIGVLALVPVIFLAFLVLCRSQAWRVTSIYLVANALLLIPTRNPDLIGLMSACTLLIIATLDTAAFSALPAMRTKEGRFVRLMLYVPALCMIGRNLQLYSTSELFYSMCFAAASVYLFEVIPQHTSKIHLVKFSRFLSTITSAMAWALICFKAKSAFQLPADYLIPMLSLPYCVILVAMSFVAGQQYRKAAALIAIFAMSLQLYIFEGVLSSLLIVAVSIVTSAYGYTSEERLTFLSGIAGLIIGLAYHLRYAVDIYTLSPWLSLGVLGVGTVLASSIIEKHYSGLVKKAGLLRHKMSTWQ